MASSVGLIVKRIARHIFRAIPSHWKDKLLFKLFSQFSNRALIRLFLARVNQFTQKDILFVIHGALIKLPQNSRESLSRQLRKDLKFDQADKFVERFSQSDAAPKLLVFGDSVSLRTADEDNSNYDFNQLLRNKLDAENLFCLISGSGYHPEVFFHFCQLLVQQTNLPQLVVIPINIRSFSPSWDLSPLYQFHIEINYLQSKKLGKEFTQSAEFIEDSTKIFHGIPLQYPGEDIQTVGEFESIIEKRPEVESGAEWNYRLNRIFTYHYMFPITQTHRKIKCLMDSVDLLIKFGVPVYLYFTPINYEGGIKFVGNHFVDRVNSNIATIRSSLEASTVKIVGIGNALLIDDFSAKFGSKMFFTEHNATEHLRAEGRNFLIDCIVEVFKKISKGSNE